MAHTRDEIFRKFGPFIMEAMCILIVEQFNQLRALHGLPGLTADQVGNALYDKIESLVPYDWIVT